MKTIHLHIVVDDLVAAKQFYEDLFGVEATVQKPDYAKWLLDDPRVNLAISGRNANASGVDHIGIQVDSAAELEELATRLRSAGHGTVDERAANCCYAESDKHWAADPAGTTWELFHTTGTSAALHNTNPIPQQTAASNECCESTGCCPAV